MRTMILALDHPTSVALPFFYAFSSCDVVSSFHSKEKCKGWDLWILNRFDFDEVFIRFGNRPSHVTDADMNAIERFVMKMYPKLSKMSLTDLRIDMFISLTNNDLRKLPLSRRALEQHGRALEELVVELVMFGKSQLVIPLSLILKTGDGYLKEICISHDGNKKSVKKRSKV